MELHPILVTTMDRSVTHLHSIQVLNQDIRHSTTVADLLGQKKIIYGNRDLINKVCKVHCILALFVQEHIDGNLIIFDDLISHLRDHHLHRVNLEGQQEEELEERRQEVVEEL